MRFFRTFQKTELWILFIIVMGICSDLSGQNPARNIRSLLKTAKTLEKNHQYETALTLYQRIYKSDSRNFAAITGIKNCLIGLQRYEEITGFLEAVLQTQPQSSPLHIDLAEAYFLQNEQEKAFSKWHSHIEQNIDDPAAYRLVAMSMIRQRLFDEAISVYTNAIARIKNQYNLHVDIANLYRAQLNYEKASDHFLEYYLARPKQLAFLRQQLLSLSDKGNDIKPIENSIERFLIEHPDKRDVKEILAGLYLKNRQYDKALHIYKSLETKQSSGGYLQRYAIEALSNRAYQYAIEGFQQIIQTYPASPLLKQVRFDLARSYNALAGITEDEELSGQYVKKAVNIYQDIIKTWPKSDQSQKSHIQLAQLYFHHFFDLDKSINYYTIYIKSFPKSKKKDLVLLQLGDVYLTKNQIDRARKTYKAVTKKNNIIHAEFRVAELEFFQAQFKLADNLYAKLLTKMKSNNPLMNDILSRRVLIRSFASDSVTLAIFSQAELLKFQKKYALAAEKYFEISQNKNDLRSLAGIEAAKLYLKLTEYEEAKDLLSGLMTHIPEDKDIDEVLYLLAGTEEKLDNPQTALQIYHQLMRRYPTSLYVQKARRKARELSHKLTNEQI